MTQDLRGHVNRVERNLPSQFYLFCTRCGRRTPEVRYSPRAGANICLPDCPTVKSKENRS